MRAGLLDDLGEPPVLRIGGERLPVLGRARIYVCGITPYDTTHVGHAATFIWTDAAARVLRLTGCEVDVCRNVTDVDDHLLAQARLLGTSWKSLATQQTYLFERDMENLGVARPSYEPRSHDHVDDVIELARELLGRGLAYTRDGSVHFRGADVHEAAGLTRDEALARAAELGPAGKPAEGLRGGETYDKCGGQAFQAHHVWLRYAGLPYRRVDELGYPGGVGGR